VPTSFAHGRNRAFGNALHQGWPEARKSHRGPHRLNAQAPGDPESVTEPSKPVGATSRAQPLTIKPTAHPSRDDDRRCAPHDQTPSESLRALRLRVIPTFRPKFLPLKKRILLRRLRFRENCISVYWVHQPQELERPLLKWCGLCKLIERHPLQARRHARAVTTPGLEGN